MDSPHKNQPFLRRAAFAWQGIKTAFLTEQSFKIEVVAAVMALGVTAWLRPGWLWAALIVVMIALVLALELVNTALEAALDGLHPDQAKFVKVAKDCAAGAVLCVSVASVLVFICLVFSVHLH